MNQHIDRIFDAPIKAPKGTPKIHRRNRRLMVNAGINFPNCCSGSSFLDMNKSMWTLTSNKYEVTCKNCLKMVE